MSPPRTSASGPGEAFEDLAELIFRVLTARPADGGHVEVQRNVLLEGADGSRQIDLVLRSTAGPIALTTIIECKDYKRRVDVTTIDALHSVALDVKASRAVLVSRGGFSKTAVQKARRLGIALYSANRIGDMTEEYFQVPIYVREIRPTGVQIVAKMELKEGDQVGVQDMSVVNGRDLLIELRDELIATESLIGSAVGEQEWVPTDLAEPLSFRTAAGADRKMRELAIRFTVGERHFFGYLSDISQALVLRDNLEAKANVLIPAESLTVDYEANFIEIDSYDALPATPILTAEVAVVPDPHTDVVSSSVSAKRIGPAGTWHGPNSQP